MEKLPLFKDLAQKHTWLVSNKLALIAQKKSVVKLADAVSTPFYFLVNESKIDVTKQDQSAALKDAKSIKVVSIINTTKLFDSHGDVHIDGLWTKSIKESKTNYLVKQHDFSFDGTISDDVKASAQDFTWKELGFDYEGKTQALVYESVIDNSDKTGMFERYKANKVPQHSVGMRYVKLALAFDNKQYPDEMKVWKDYYDMIANKAEVDEAGYFWAVTEAKNIEGSAVMRGSNYATPTQSVEAFEPEKSTQAEPFYKTLKIPEPSNSRILNLKI